MTEKISEFSGYDACAEEKALESSEKRVLVQTAKAEVKNKNNLKHQEVRILFDSGSQRTYVTENLAEKLQLSKKGEEELKLETFGSDKP